MDELSKIFEALEDHLPRKNKIDVKKEKSGRKKVVEYNKELIDTYLASQLEHLKQQKWVGLIITVAVSIQLVAVNALIWRTLDVMELEKMKLVLDFMKYYTGAVIVEMIGLCWIVVKGVYSKSIEKVVEHIVKK